jgi:hypothetical protein
MNRRKETLATGIALLLLSVIIVLLALYGCAARAKHVTNLPPGVSEQQVKNWDSAVAALHKIAITTTTLRQAVIALNRATYTEAGKSEPEKIIPDGKTYIALLSAIARVDQAQIDAANFLKTVPSSWSLSTQEKVRAYMKTIADELAQMNAQGVTGIKSVSAQQQIQQLIAEIQATVGLILSLSQ